MRRTLAVCTRVRFARTVALGSAVMKTVQFLGPAVGFIAVVATFAAGIFADVHLAAWVLAGFLVVFTLLRVLVPEPRAWGLAVRSLPVDVAILLIGAVAIVFLAQTAPDLY